MLLFSVIRPSLYNRVFHACRWNQQHDLRSPYEPDVLFTSTEMTEKSRQRKTEYRAYDPYKLIINPRLVLL